MSLPGAKPSSLPSSRGKYSGSSALGLPGAKPSLPSSRGKYSDSSLPPAAGKYGGLPGAKPSKGSGGLLGVGKSLLGEVTEFLGAPQQVLFKGVRGVGQVATGDVRGGAGTLASAAKSAAALIPGAGLALNETPITATEALQPFGVNKLPRGLDTGLSVVADPLNVATFGAGSVAKAGLRTAAKELGGGAAEKIAAQGLRKGLTEAEKQTLRSALVRGAEVAGARNAERTAARQFKAVAARGRGGLGVRVPFTGLGAPIIPGATLGRLGEASGATAAKQLVAGSRPVRALGRAFIPGRAVAEEVGREASERVLEAGRARSAAENTAVADLFARTKAAMDDFGKFSAADDAFVHAALEGGDAAIEAAKQARPELSRVIDTFDAMRRSTGQEQVAAKVLSPDALRDEASYLHRVLTPEAQRAFGRIERETVRSGGSVRSALNQGAAKARKVAPDFTARQINEAIAAEQARAAAKAAPAAAKAAPDAPAAKIKTVAERVAEKADADELARLEREAAEAQKRADAAARRAAGISEPKPKPAPKPKPVSDDLRARKAAEAASEERRSLVSEIANAKTELSTKFGGKDPAKLGGESYRQYVELTESIATKERRLASLPAPEDLPRLERRGRGLSPAERADRQRPTLAGVRQTELEAAGENLVAAERGAAEQAAKKRALSEVRSEAAKLRWAKQKAAKDTAASVTEKLAADAPVADDVLADSVRRIAQTLKPGEKLYRESAVTSLLDRGVEASKAIATAGYVADLRGIVDDTGEKILLSADDVASGAAVPDGWVKFDLPKLGTFHAPKVLRDEIVGAVGRLEDPSGLRKAFDSADRWWRTQVTASLPGGIPFAARNARTNVMLMWLSGTNVPKYMREGAALQRDVRRVLADHAAEVADNGVEAAMRKYLGDRDFGLWNAARRNGIIGEGFYEVDLSHAPTLNVKGAAKGGGKLRRATRFAAGTEGTLAKKGRNINTAVEQHARLSQFLADVDRLGNVDAAVRRTKDVLFDYSALTPTERTIKRWGMPFYTFARKNLPAQVRSFIEAPGRYVLPEKLAQATTDPLPEGSPEWQERGGARLSRIPGFRGLVTTPERPLHAAVETLAPAFDLATGNGQEGLRGALSNIGGVPGAPGKALFEHATGKSVFTGYNLPKSASERQKIALQTALPQLGRRPLSTYLPTATEAQKKKRDQPPLAQLLRLAGVGLEPVNEKERKRQLRLRRAAAAAERNSK